MIHDPLRIINSDESEFILHVKADQTINTIGSKNGYQVRINTKTPINVMACLEAFRNFVSETV